MQKYINAMQKYPQFISPSQSTDMVNTDMVCDRGFENICVKTVMFCDDCRSELMFGFGFSVSVVFVDVCVHCSCLVMCVFAVNAC